MHKLWGSSHSRPISPDFGFGAPRTQVRAASALTQCALVLHIDPMTEPPILGGHMEHRQVVAVTVGGAVFTAGTTALIGAVVVAITSPDQEGALWFRPIVYAGIAVAIMGVYLLFAAWLGLWLPSPRSRFIGRTLWDRVYFSKASRSRRDWGKRRPADDRLRERIRLEAEAAAAVRMETWR